jgi:hypothetical protein
MPVNNRNHSSPRRMPMNLEGRYGKIGCWRDRSQQRTTEASEGLILNPGPPDSPLPPVASDRSASIRRAEAPCARLSCHRLELTRIGS